MTQRIRELTGIPVVTLTYDGTSDRMNDAIVPYIHHAMSGKVTQPSSFYVSDSGN